MKNVRELIGSLTQARVQLLAAKSILHDEENDNENDSEANLATDFAGVLEEALGQVECVRKAYSTAKKGQDDRYDPVHPSDSTHL